MKRTGQCRRHAAGLTPSAVQGRLGPGLTARIAAGAVMFATAALAEETSLPAITPIPQHIASWPGVCQLAGVEVRCSSAFGFASDTVRDALREALPNPTGGSAEYPIRIGLSTESNTASALASAGVSFGRNIGPEGYLLAIRPRGIVLAGRDAPGVRWGAYTLAQVIRQNRDGEMPCLTIRDWPDFAFRGEVLLYLPEDRPKQCWERMIDLMAAHKMNYMMSYVLFHFPSHPEISAVDNISWGPEDWVGKFRYARSRGIEWIPIMDANMVAKNHPELLRPYKPMGTAVYDPMIPKVWDIASDVYGDLCRPLRPKFVNVEHDELITAYSYPIREQYYATSVGEALLRPHEILAHALKEMRRIIHENGARMMVFGDWALNHWDYVGKTQMNLADGNFGGPPDNLYLARNLAPKDIVLIDWHYDVSTNYLTTKTLMSLGFPVVCCPWYERNSYFFSRYARGLKPRPLGMLGSNWDAERKSWDRLLRKVRADAQHFWSASPPPDDTSRRLLQSMERNPLKNIPPGPFAVELPLGSEDGSHLWTAGRLHLYHQVDAGQENELPGLALSPTFFGILFVDVSAARGCGFRDLRLKVWMPKLGPNSITVSGDGGCTYDVVSHDRDLNGDDVPVPQAAGRCFLRFRFSTQNTTSGPATALRRVDISGQVTRLSQRQDLLPLDQAHH